MRFKTLSLLALGTLLFSVSGNAANSYGLPDDIKEGNILHCFDWKFSSIKSELPNIAEAGFKAIQVSPIQRNVNAGNIWYDLYRPADYAAYNNGLGTVAALKTLCEEAETYGIAIIVDVVLNHMDNSPYHLNWWDSNGRLRSTTSYINYSNRNSITHDRLGAYPEVNTEDPEVIARAKAYIEELKSYGVKGVRFDAAKHIGLPSEGSDFWKEVTSVPGMFYYGELLGTPGGTNSNALVQEYATFMSITDSQYSDGARANDGVPGAAAGWANALIDESKCVYWGESHDTYSNEGGASKNTPQERIDRAYAILASRSKGMGLYFSRPASTKCTEIKVGQKGSTHFMDKPVAEVNKFKNAMVGKAHSYTNGGSASSVTRNGGGAVVVRKGGAGTVSVANGGGYCPAGTYIDRVSGNTFTVTSSTISGTVDSSGIAVLYNNASSGVDEVGVADTLQGEEVWYTLQGIRVADPSAPGIYIVATPGGNTRKVMVK